MSTKSETEEREERIIEETYLLTLKFGEVLPLHIIDEHKFVPLNYGVWDRKQDPALFTSNDTRGELILVTPPNSTLKRPKAVTRNVILIDRFSREGFIRPVWLGIFIDCESNRYFYENSRSIYKLAVQNAKYANKQRK